MFRETTASATFAPSRLQYSLTPPEPAYMFYQFNRRPSLPWKPTTPGLLSPTSQAATSQRAASWTSGVPTTSTFIPPSTPPSSRNNSSISPPPISPQQPAQPLPWLWQCHLCHRSYSLGVTRTCLEDGHTFCAGELMQRSSSHRRRSSGAVRCGKRGKACASEFDYRGWGEVGKWRRDVGAARSHTPKPTGLGTRRDSAISLNATAAPKDCFNNCDYPSECRWGREEQLQRLEKEVLERETAVAARLDQQHGLSPPTSFEEILGLSLPTIDRDWSFAKYLLHCSTATGLDIQDTEDDGAHNEGALAFVPESVKGQIKACGYFQDEVMMETAT